MIGLKVIKRNGIAVTTIQLGFVWSCLVMACSAECHSHDELREASGIATVGSEFVVVSDGSPGAIYRIAIPVIDSDSATDSLLAVIQIDEWQKDIIGSNLAVDLEAIDVLDDGSVVTLSERLDGLITRDGLAAIYPDSMSEIAGRGLEGLSILDNDHVAALWEGGFLTPRRLPTSVKDAGNLTSGPINPLVCIHAFPETPGTVVCPDGRGIRSLQVPAVPHPTQVFRAPDLVWDVDGNSFIVLLSSMNDADNEYKFKWLQRFSLNGEIIGDPINLCDRGLLPEYLRSGREGNFEGLDWFEHGKSLVLVNDFFAGATIVVVKVNPWPSTDKTIACDQELH